MINVKKELYQDLRRIVRMNRKKELPKRLMAYVMDKYYPKLAIVNRAGNMACLEPQQVIGLIVRHFGYSLETLKKKNKKEEYVHARAACMYLLLLRTQLTQKAIGELFGGRDHTTVLNAKRHLKGLMDVYPDIRHEMEYLNRQL